MRVRKVDKAHEGQISFMWLTQNIPGVVHGHIIYYMKYEAEGAGLKGKKNKHIRRTERKKNERDS